MNKKINLLSISFDQNIADQKFSDARERQLEYVKYFNEYKLILLNTRENYFKKEKIGNLSIIPTNSIIKPFAIFDSILIALKEHKKTPFNLITAQDPLVTGLVAIILKWLLKLPLNIQLHIDYHLDKYWPSERWQNKLLIPLINWEIHQADSLRVDNKAKFNKLKNKFPNLSANIFQAPMRVDLEYFYKKATERKQIKKLISVGRLIKQKNHPMLISAMKRVIKEYPTITLTIAGGGEEEGKLKKLIYKNKLNKSIRLIGSISRDKIRKLLHDSDLFVLASNHEGWGLVYIEAFAAGLPVVTTKVSSEGEVVKDGFNGYTVPLEDEQQLAKRINHLIENPRVAFEFSKNGQQMAREIFSPENMIRKWVDGLYETAKAN